MRGIRDLSDSVVLGFGLLGRSNRLPQHILGEFDGAIRMGLDPTMIMRRGRKRALMAGGGLLGAGAIGRSVATRGLRGRSSGGSTYPGMY